MILTVTREIFTDHSTTGMLYVDEAFFCYTLEDRDRQKQADGSIIPWVPSLKIPKETAIPYGTYQVITDYSNRFKKVMPHILNVPNFEGIRIHSGNTDHDTEGCLLLGMSLNKDFVGRSKEAFDKFFSLLQKALKEDHVSITYK